MGSPTTSTISRINHKNADGLFHLPLPTGSTCHLESLLNFGCKILLCKRRDFSSTTALHELGLTTLNSRRRLHTVQCMFRCLSSQAPSYLTRLFSSTTQHHNTHSSSTRQLNLPPVKSSFGQRAFSFAGPSLWRSLPPAIRKAQDYRHFSEQCRHFYSNA